MRGARCLHPRPERILPLGPTHTLLQDWISIFCSSLSLIELWYVPQSDVLYRPRPPLMSLIWLTSPRTLSIPILMLICYLVNIIYSFFSQPWCPESIDEIAILILEAFRIWLVSLLIRQCRFLLSIIKFRSASDRSRSSVQKSRRILPNIFHVLQQLFLNSPN